VRRPLLVGVAGGSGSGKTTVVERLIEALAPEPVSRIQHDAYYRDYAHLSEAERSAINFDHPDALESDLLVEHLDALCEGRLVRVPVYDFTTHTRLEEIHEVRPTRVVLVDGILVLAEPEVRRRLDLAIFVDTAADVRLQRRIERDLVERGRTSESVLRQHENTVHPMHLEFVEPSKGYADLIIPRGGENEVAVQMVSAHLRSLVNG
jgi:uridine kinase